MRRCRASVFLPLRVRFGVQPAGTVEAEDHDRRRQAKIAQRLQREVRRYIPARLEGVLSRPEGLGVTTTQARVGGHVFRPEHVAVLAAREPSLQPQLCGSTWRVKASLAALAADAALTRPRRSLGIGNYWSDGHHVAGEVLSGPGAAGIPCRGERFAAPRVFKWVVKKTPKFRDNLGQ